MFAQWLHAAKASACIRGMFSMCRSFGMCVSFSVGCGIVTSLMLSFMLMSGLGVSLMMVRCMMLMGVIVVTIMMSMMLVMMHHLLMLLNNILQLMSLELKIVLAVDSNINLMPMNMANLYSSSSCNERKEPHCFLSN